MCLIFRLKEQEVLFTEQVQSIENIRQSSIHISIRSGLWTDIENKVFESLGYKIFKAHTENVKHACV